MTASRSALSVRSALPPVSWAKRSAASRDPAYVKVTAAPSAAKRRTMAAPMPRLPPTTNTDFPLNVPTPASLRINLRTAT
jgi:hypothetical protein